MTDLESVVVRQTKDLVEGKNEGHELLDSLLGLDRENITGKAAIRYLLQAKAWELTLTNPFAPAMEHLFAHYEGKPKEEPEVYRAKTRDLIKDLWGFECVEAPLAPEKPPYQPPEKKAPPKKRAAPKTSKTNTRSVETSDISTDIDTKGASSRLKKVIAIQRGLKP